MPKINKLIIVVIIIIIIIIIIIMIVIVIMCPCIILFCDQRRTSKILEERRKIMQYPKNCVFFRLGVTSFFSLALYI